MGDVRAVLAFAPIGSPRWAPSSAGVAHEINNPLTYVLVNIEHVARAASRLRVATGEPLGLEDIEAQLATLAQALEGATRVRGITCVFLMTFASGQHPGTKSLVDVRPRARRVPADDGT